MMTYDDNNRLATFNGTNVTHDSDGNMTSAPLTNSDFATYTYDARNHLINVGGTNSVSPHSYGYDPLGNRTSITNGTNLTKFIINPNAALSQALVRVKNGVTNYYVYGVGLLYEVDASENTKTYHSDYRGSTIALTADSGSVIDRMEYSAYGTTTYRASTNDTPFLYNGHYGVQTDANGLLYMRARYYNPFLCRFINADPSGFAGGLNHYAFADGNPVSMLDPFGLDAFGAYVESSYLGGNNSVANVSLPIEIENYVSMFSPFDPLTYTPNSSLSSGSTANYPTATLNATLPPSSTYDALLIGAPHLVGTPVGYQIAQGNAIDYLTAFALGFSSTLQIKIAAHGSHHSFGTLGRLPHVQLNWWRTGVRGSGGAIRVPVPPGTPGFPP